MVENISAEAERTGKDYKEFLNPDSLVSLKGCKLEPSVASSRPLGRYQFERQGYFCADSKDSTGQALVFNRTVTLRDSWAKIEKTASGTKPSAKGKAPEKKTHATEKPAPGKQPEITIDDFSKLDLRVGKIMEASDVQGSDKMVRLMIDLGEGRNRQIFAGIRGAYPDMASLVNKKVIVVANLKPRQMKFGTSEGMILAGGRGDIWSICTFDGDPEPGDKVS